MRLFGLVLLILLGPLGCSTLGTEARLVLEDVAAGTGPSRLKEQTASPARKTVRFVQNGITYRADRYTPAGPPRGGIVLVPGLAEAGKDDFRLVAFATTLARARYIVLVPDIENLRQLRIGPDDTRRIADSFTYLQRTLSHHPALPLGIAAFSYAAGPAIQAAMQTDIQHHVDFVLAIGTYYNLENTLRFFTTGYYRIEEQWQHRKPSEYGKLVFALSTVELLTQAKDRRLFRQLVNLKLANPDADTAAIARGLSPEGGKLYQLLTHTRPEMTASLLAQQPVTIRSRVARLNLANKDLAQLKAELILVHGKNDDIIPYSESLDLAAALPNQNAQVFIIEGMSHIDVISRDFDRVHMWEAIKAFLNLQKQDDSDTH